MSVRSSEKFAIIRTRETKRVDSARSCKTGSRGSRLVIELPNETSSEPISEKRTAKD